MIKYSGTLKDAGGHPRVGAVNITFAIYETEDATSPLWMESQTVTADETGHYSVLLGSTKTDGLPASIFASAEARWIGVRAQGQAEQSRVLLVSVPYAIKAGDADTLGGLPASAFLLAQSASSSKNAPDRLQAMRDISSPTLGSPMGVMTTGGTANMLSKFSNASTIVDSTIFESNGRIGIGTTTPDSTVNLVASGDADPLWHATKNFVGDNTQFGNLLWFEGNLQFTADGSPGVQALDMGLFIPASNTFHVQKMISQALFAENDGTGKVNVITGTESDVYTSAGSSDFVEGMDFSAQNDGAIVDVLRGGATSADATGGTTNNLMGFQIRTNNVSSPVNNNYGLKIDAQSGGTNTWALKTETGIVQFGDKTMLAASTATGASLNIPSGSAPSSPAAGDVWNDGTNLIIKTGGVIKPLAFADSVTTSVATETTRATAAETTLTSNLATANTAITANTTNITANASALAAEVTRAQAVEANLRVRGIAYVAGCDSCNLLQTNDSEKTIYVNVVGAMTINQVTCFSDAGSPTINLQRDDGSPANILSADLACSTTGAITTGIVSAESVLNLNDKIDFYVTSAGGAAHRVTVVIKTTLN